LLFRRKEGRKEGRKEKRGCCLGSKLIWDGILEEETLKLEVQVLRISILYLVVIGGRDEESW
jgi:hypothetical protein